MSEGEVWDDLAASAPLPESTTASRCSRLRLRGGPLRAWIPRKDRSVAEIEPTLRAAIRACVGGESPWPLVCFGPPGTGKTCAGLALLDVVAHGSGFYYTAAGLCEELILAGRGHLATPSGRKVNQAQLWHEIADTCLVVLDELGGRPDVSSHHYECVKRLLDEREGSPLMVLSNLALPHLEKLYDDRVTSRLAAGTLVCVEGADRRLPRRGPKDGGLKDGGPKDDG